MQNRSLATNVAPGAMSKSISGQIISGHPCDGSTVARAIRRHG